MRTEWRATILIAAGGTGGHLFPGIAVADELRRARPRATRVVFVGTPRGLESRLVPRAGYALELLPILPAQRGGRRCALLKGSLALPVGAARARARARAPPAPRGRARRRRLRRRAGRAGRGAPRGAHGDPRAQREARLHEPRPAALRAPRRLRLRRDAPRRSARRASLTGNPVRGGFASLAAQGARARRCTCSSSAAARARASSTAPLVGGAAAPAAAPTACASSTRRARPCATRWPPPTRRRAARPRCWPSSTTWSGASPRPTSCCRRSGATTCAELAAAGKAAVLVPFARGRRRPPAQERARPRSRRARRA